MGIGKGGRYEERRGGRGLEGGMWRMEGGGGKERGWDLGLKGQKKKREELRKRKKGVKRKRGGRGGEEGKEVREKEEEEEEEMVEEGGRISLTQHTTKKHKRERRSKNCEKFLKKDKNQIEIEEEC